MDLFIVAYIHLYFKLFVVSSFLFVAVCSEHRKERSCVANLLSKFRIICSDVLTVLMQEVAVFMCNEVCSFCCSVSSGTRQERTESCATSKESPR